MDKEDLDIAAFVPKIKKNPHGFLLKLNRNNREYMIRKTEWVTEIIYQGKQYLFTSNNDKLSSEYLWIYSEVKRQAEALLKKIEEGTVEWVEQPPFPSSRLNVEYDDTKGIITGTDLAMAYWTIARKLGIINNTLFDRFTSPQFKIIRLSALAVLGRPKMYEQRLPDGGVVKHVVEGDPKLRKLYDSIRYHCFGHMNHLASALGEDFDCYKTDCIYYRDTKKNRDMVCKYFAEHGFKFRQLVFEDEIQQSKRKSKKK